MTRARSVRRQTLERRPSDLVTPTDAIDLVTTASHDLKTPLSSIRLALHLLLEGAVGALTPKQTELLLDARDNAERLLDLINDMLNLGRLEGGGEHLDVGPESAADLLRSAARGIFRRMQDKGVALVIHAADDLPPVSADPRCLARALANLMENALAHTPQGGQVTLSAEGTGDRVTITVADTGRGIAPEHLPHLLEPFFRVPGESHEGGTGLGLAIVRGIVISHGGSITCESTPGIGTTFRLALPAWTNGCLRTRGQGTD